MLSSLVFHCQHGFRQLLIPLYDYFFFATVVLSWEIPAEYPIKPSPDGRNFITSKGEPFFWQADTAWVLFHRLTLAEVETYLDDRAAKGFNMLLAVAVNQFG